MPRLPRIDIPDLPQHIVVRGNNRGRCFFDDGDRFVFMRHLVDSAKVRGCDLHAYVLMTNHAHLLATAHSHGAISQWMQDMGRKYVRYLNVRHGRTGGLFEGRFRASVVDSDRYFLACMRYIEMNPVRAGMVGGPLDYDWSSHRANASGVPGEPLMAHAEYLKLAADPHERGRVYRTLFETVAGDHELESIRGSLAMNRALGGDGFIAALSSRIDRNAGVVLPGRPKKGTGSKVL